MRRATSEPPVGELVCRAREGDEKAFNALVYRCQDMAVGYARSLLGSPSLAEDAAQEAFIDAFARLRDLREPDKFVPWLRTIVFKHCDRIRRRAAVRVATLEAAEQIPDPRVSPPDALLQRHTEELVRAAMSALTEAERLAVELYYAGERSQSEIAGFLGITINAVKTRLYSARRKLKQRMMTMVENHLHQDRPSRDGQFAERVLRSALPMQLYTVDETARTTQPAGTTAGLRYAGRPGARVWFVKPTGALSGEQWDRVYEFVESHAVPGLAAGDGFTDRLLERFSRLPGLLYLDLSGSQVTDAGLQALANTPHLEHLSIGRCPGITDSGLQALRFTPKLTHFHADHHPGLTDAGIRHLSSHAALQSVTLLGTRTGDGAASALAGKASLAYLTLGSLLTDAGLARLSEYPAFRTWLSAVPPGEMAPPAQLGVASHPTYLMINLKAPITDAGLASLVGLEGLYALNLFGTTGSTVFDDSASPVSARGIAHLAQMANLGWLGCCAGKCTDAAMEQIAAMPRLKFLNCQDTVAGDAGFAALSRSHSIQGVWGRRSCNIGSRGFAALAAMPALSDLSVSCRNVDEAGLSALPSFPALRELMPIDVPDSGFAHIGRCRKLETLNNMYCPEMTDAAAEHLRETALTTYRVWGTRISNRTLEALGALHSLERLLFYNCGITDAGLIHIAELPHLKSVSLESLPGVTEVGIARFPGQVQVSWEP